MRDSLKVLPACLAFSLFMSFALGAAAASGSPAGLSNYAGHEKFAAFADKMVDEHQFDRAALERMFEQASRQQSILDAIARPAEKTKPWKDYRKIFLGSRRINNGVRFAREHEETLARAEQAYGVPRHIIVAVIGVETLYGSNTGSYRVIDALATLAFDYPKRSPFFTSELEHYLLLTREQQVDALSLKGSYAGAMGYGQFMPSSYRAYAVDFDGDGLVDIWKNPVDAIGSVANYFKKHGWLPGAPVVSRARVNGGFDESAVNQGLKPVHTVAEFGTRGFTPVEDYAGEEKATVMKLEGDNGAEFWMGLTNFYVITRYNHSKLYAMAVYQLSEEIRSELD
jgi:membrane-bound lytic murein transglycosylase B